MNRYERLVHIVLKYREELQKKIKYREIEMQKDNTDHYIVYNALGFTRRSCMELYKKGNRY